MVRNKVKRLCFIFMVALFLHPGNLLASGISYIDSSSCCYKTYLHPYFVSVVEINYSTKEKTLEITCKIFTDDFEKTLRQNYKSAVDLVQVKNRQEMDRIVKDYIQKHFQVKADGKLLPLKFLGFEKEEASVYSYFEVTGIPAIKKLEVMANLLYDYKREQVNLVHVTVNGKRQSTKLENPQRNASFEF